LASLETTGTEKEKGRTLFVWDLGIEQEMSINGIAPEWEDGLPLPKVPYWVPQLF